MIGRAYKVGTGFKGLAAYLERGHLDEPNPDRVDWVESRNLPTERPQAAARIMAATARDSDSIQPPVYHLSISFDPADPVNRDTMRQVADRTLRDLGLQDHQALIVAHNDRGHPHMHLMVNRVDPERRNVWSNWNDYHRIEKSLRQQEQDLGLRVVPGRHARVPEQGRDPIPRASERVRGDAEFLARVQKDAGPHLTGARSWAELERSLAAHGLAVEMKGRGMVVHDGAREVKASEVDPAASRHAVQRRLGQYGDYKARQAVAGRTLDERAARQERAPAPERVDRAAPAPPARQPRARDTRPANTPHTPSPQPAREPHPPRARTGPGAQYRQAARDFSREMAAVYDNPERAQRAFQLAARLDGREAAVRALRARPDDYGRVIDRTRAAHAADAADRFTSWRDQRQRPQLRELAGHIREHESATVAERRISGAVRGEATARDRLHAMQAPRAERLRLARDVRAGARSVYEQPDRAAAEIARAMRRDGAAATARAVADQPERFGRLQAVEHRRFAGLVKHRDDTAARSRAVGLGESVRRAGRAMEAAPRAGDVLRAGEALKVAQKAVAVARQLTPPRSAHEAMQRAARLAYQLAREGLNVAASLTPMLPAQSLGLVRKAVELGRDLAIGRDREHQRERGGLSL